MTTRPAALRLAPDHIVVAARTLDEGAAWCLRTLGVVAGPGGKHALMGTHNRIVSLATPRFPDCYLEIIAIDPEAPAPPRRRWFDLDSPHLLAAIAERPRLVHWVARAGALDAALAALRAAGHDPGEPVAAERMTAHGLLRWRITLRDDGARPAGGAVPLLIEWESDHPCRSLPASGLALEAVRIGGIAPDLVDALVGVGEGNHRVEASALAVTLATPNGQVELTSP